ncbi:CRISPR-associated helicase Cas3' [Sulfurihydrogenibium sp.]|uniref:CRISPR-associated helicase Cas3' n=1 Tax=Sulfurihydrogenibium sp. TaxID=2053621 RepID=UPI00261CDD17|nr:CRISPR-associated helicase Cas3' [Sulfurihydrogenibium sp.]
MNASGIFSHPDRYLEQHLSNVIEIGLKFFDEIFSDEISKDIFTIIAFSHDIGKTTKFFQEYITKKDRNLKSKKETKHSLLGAVVSLHLTDRYLKSKCIDNKFLLALSFIIPKRHHSNLKEFLYEFIIEDEEKNILKKQIESIDKEKFNHFLELLRIEKKEIVSFDFNDINLEEIEIKLLEIKRYIRKLEKDSTLDYFIDTAIFYSLLLDADKSDVGIKTDKSILFKNIDINPKIVDQYVSKLKNTENDLHNLRYQAYKEVSEKEINLNEKIYTITLPTGIGKTLISLKVALNIADRFKKEKGKNLKIIYCLPFLSVIEQNYKVIENLLKESMSLDNSILMKYHHLTGFNYKGEDDEFDYDTSRILIEGFNSKIITTTFIQFFYSFIGNKNKMLRKFHKFTNSIVILDEIQSIPHHFWLLIKETLYKMAERFNFYVILSTATQPMIFDKHVELADYQKYFEALNRYNIHINKTPQTLQEFYKSVKIEDNKFYLFIMNTVNSAKELYNLLKNEYKDEILFLSTHIVPKQRLERINQIKEKKKRIVVSTQLVEVGVDVDFDVVYRDFAPLDSVIQSAGRCNREGKKEKGILYLVNLKDENGRFYHSYIYSNILTYITQEVLKENFYEEKDILNLSKKYYQLVKERVSDDKSVELLKALYGLKFSGDKEKDRINSIEDFVLIQEDFYKSDVFVEIDEKAEKVWKEYENILKIEDVFERKEAFDRIKKDFYDYVISVPIKENIPLFENYFYYIPKSNLDEYYDIESGFKIKTEGYLEY